MDATGARKTLVLAGRRARLRRNGVRNSFDVVSGGIK
jgi:hypothetical protein